MEKEYPISLGMKMFYGIFSAVIFLIGLFLFNIPHTVKTPAWFDIFPTLMLVTSIFIFVNIFKKKVIVYDERIVTIGLFLTKELFIDSIKGVRIESKIVFIEPINAADNQLRIGSYYELKNSDQLVKWLQDNFTDLNSVDLADEQNKILHNSELGVTETDREQTLKKTKKIAQIYNIGGAVAVIFILVFSNTVKAAIVGIVYPLISIVIIANSKGLVKFVSNPQRSISSSVLFGFVLPSFSALLISEIYTIYKSTNLWLPVLCISTFIFIVVYKIGINKSIKQIKGQAIIMFMFVTLYGFASTLQINCALDIFPGQIYKVAVLDERIISSGRRNSYYLKLSAWGPTETGKEVEVRRRVYDRVDVGDSVNVVFKQGLLHIPWFIVTHE